MVKTNELTAIVEKIAKWADEHLCVRKITLFGSRIRGDNTESSDLDLLIEADFGTVGTTAVEDWQEQRSTVFASLRSQFSFDLAIVLDTEIRPFGQTMEFIRAGQRLPDLKMRKVGCVWTKPK